ncbi:MAG: TlpA family protein disulfide reductase [Planctomycetes bacterium]|nr:TlpA family protein disulfide reductase [Planctomycetota bacterium]
MPEKNKFIRFFLYKLGGFMPLTFIGVFILLLVTTAPLMMRIKSTPAQMEQPAVETQSIDNKQPITRTEKKTQKRNLNNIILAARTWGPVLKSWHGQTATDFTLPDLNGKEHKLSDYNGKDVIIVFWATWCGPCIREIPHLKKLRNTIRKDKLAILAISNEPTDLLERFAKKRRINYTVLSSNGNPLPAPFDRVTSIPTTFFIDSTGKIKLAASGMISLGELKAILKAE